MPGNFQRMAGPVQPGIAARLDRPWMSDRESCRGNPPRRDPDCSLGKGRRTELWQESLDRGAIRLEPGREHQRLA